MNKLLNGLIDETNYILTENNAITHKTTKSALLDMFAMGAAMRNRSDEDIVLMFRKAYAENPVYALKCLFYIRDVRGGQGERRFFRICLKDLANQDAAAARRNLKYIPEFGRWDDLYAFIDTPVEADAFEFIKLQFKLDLSSNVPSLLGKWLKSENTSSKESRRLAGITREYLRLSPKSYRKALSCLRSRINVLETLMSENRWEEIEFDKIPSRAGLIYKNAFARKEVIAEKYKAFTKDVKTKVNADTLNPVDIANKVFSYYFDFSVNLTDRLMLDKYWQNLPNYYGGRQENGIAVVDVSASMSGQPMNAAIAMGAYIAERGKGPFTNHFITFSDKPELVEFEGVDIYDKFMKASSANWGNSTNIEATLDLLLSTALNNNCSQKDMPSRLYIFSDMEFDDAVSTVILEQSATLFEAIKRKWASYGYVLPNIIFWNLDVRQKNIPAIGEGFSYVSGFSMNMIEYILSGKDGYDLCMEKLNSKHYSVIK